MEAVANYTTDLFGNTIKDDVILRDIYKEPPFSVLDTKSASWQSRRRQWMHKGIRSELGRDAVAQTTTQFNRYDGVENNSNDTSIFDPVLCEVLYQWFLPKWGKVLDPFCGGSVRGIVAAYLGHRYIGIDIRDEQIKSNRQQAEEILPKEKDKPVYIVGDSKIALNGPWCHDFDFVFSCPPYGDLEKYSDLPGDVSNMKYTDFLAAYGDIIKQSCNLLKPGGFACFVVGEFRNKAGNYVGFVSDTMRAFVDAGMGFYNDAVLLNAVGTARLRANNYMKNKKLVKIHQNILVFIKPKLTSAAGQPAPDTE